MLIDNVLLLRERFPLVREYLSENEQKLNTNTYKTIDAKNGSKTIQCQKADASRPIMVHSLYDPVMEAEKLIAANAEAIKKVSHVFFYGAGLGYHIELFTKKYPDLTYSIYEPIPEVFLELSRTRNLKDVLTKRVFKLYVEKDNELDNAFLDEFNTTNQNIFLITLPSYENIVKEKYERFYQAIRVAVQGRRTNMHTNESFRKRWIVNSILNFGEVLSTPNILKDIDESAFKGKPAVIVSAGPSLAEDMKYIRYIKENNLAYIFSVGSAINSLIEYDVFPDAMFTYDPKRRNQNVFKKVYENNIKTIPMVFGTSVGYETIARYDGPKLHFVTSQDKASQYFLDGQINNDNHIIIDSPSIAVMTFQILNKLGASPIIFSGQNLGFLDGKRFSDGIDYEHISSEVGSKELEKALITEDVFGNEIKTNNSFNSMKKAIEHYADLYKGGIFINTTKGGAAIKGVPYQSIESVINELLNEFNKDNQFWAGMNTYNQVEIPKMLHNLDKSQKELLNKLSLIDTTLSSLSVSIKINNEINLKGNFRELHQHYNSLKQNLFFKEFLLYYIRVHIGYIENEFKSTMKERNHLIKAKRIFNAFKGFTLLCRRESLELKGLIQRNIIPKRGLS